MRPLYNSPDELVSHRDVPVICRHCGRQVKRRARQQKFCSDTCRERGRTRIRKAFLGRHSGAPTNPQKNPCRFIDLQRARMLSSYSILVPREVVEVECFAGFSWSIMTSSDGVTVAVAQLRPRALV